MYHLQRARASARVAGEPLQVVWETFRDAQVEFRRSQLHMIASGPGVGKSVMALTLAARCGARGLYLSADSDEITQYARAASMLTGDSVLEVQRHLRSGKYDEALGQISSLRFTFDPLVTLDSIEETVLCYADLWGKWPELIVVDNLLNVSADGDSEGYQADEQILSYLHEMARTTQACVVVLHHVTGAYDSGTEPVPLGGLRNKVSKLPSLVLTLYRDEDPMEGEALGVSVVKNRFGKASPGGSHVLKLDCDLEVMRIADQVKEGGLDEWTGFETEGIPMGS